MGERTGIQWTSATWNPVTGCSHVSDGCRFCYAERIAPRLARMGQTASYTDLPWTAQNAAENVKLHEDKLKLPLLWRRPRRIFVNSMSDLFHERVPFEFVVKVYATMQLAQHHTFQVLTKRPKRMLDFYQWLETDEGRRAWLAAIVGTPDGGQESWSTHWPFRNVWMGVSVEDQNTANERIPYLMEVPAVVRFLSCEPLLGPIDIDSAMYGETNHLRHRFGEEAVLTWVIGGGESGPQARPCHPDWVYSLQRQCKVAGVSWFWKQWGEHCGGWGSEDGEIHLENGQTYVSPCNQNGDSVAEDPKVRIWEVHSTGEDTCHVTCSVRVGKHAAGRMLDGRTWEEYPEPKLEGKER